MLKMTILSWIFYVLHYTDYKFYSKSPPSPCHKICMFCCTGQLTHLDSNFKMSYSDIKAVQISVQCFQPWFTAALSFCHQIQKSTLNLGYIPTFPSSLVLFFQGFLFPSPVGFYCHDFLSLISQARKEEALFSRVLPFLNCKHSENYGHPMKSK